MALNIKNPEAQSLATEIAHLTGESITSAVIAALRDRKAALERCSGRDQRLRLARQFLEREIWSIPDQPAASDVSEDELLGYGETGA